MYLLISLDNISCIMKMTPLSRDPVRHSAGSDATGQRCGNEVLLW